jgi:Tryptophan halogenase
MALQENTRYKRITIVGGGTSGYLTALFLSKKYPQIIVNWYYPGENKTIGVGEAILPEVNRFLADLGVTIENILDHCKGTLKVGALYEDFNRVGESYIFPFDMGAIDKVMHVNKIPDNICKFMNDLSVHMRITELVRYLDTILVEIPNLNIIRQEVTLADLDRTDEHLIVDSTGFQRKILNLPDNFVKPKGIFNDSAMIFRHAYTDIERQQLAYSKFKAMDSGWIFHIPLRDEVVLGYVYDKKFEAEVEVEYQEYLKQFFGIDTTLDQYKRVSMISGRNKIHLRDNIVAIGLSSAFIEPLESTGLYLVVSELRNLKRYIDYEIDEQAYNQDINEEFDIITDFIIAHYKFTKRDTPYWNQYKDIDINVDQPINIFPQEAWDFILAGFFPDVKRPAEPIADMDLLQIHKGLPFCRWLEKFLNRHDE